MIPAWLQTHLQTRGLWDADGVARTVRARRCRQCGKTILVGLDASRCAGVATVDPRLAQTTLIDLEEAQ